MTSFQENEDSSDLEVNHEMANRMSLFYAPATPMMKMLSTTTTRFVSEVRLFTLWRYPVTSHILFCVLFIEQGASHWEHDGATQHDGVYMSDYDRKSVRISHMTVKTKLSFFFVYYSGIIAQSSRAKRLWCFVWGSWSAWSCCTTTFIPSVPSLNLRILM